MELVVKSSFNGLVFFFAFKYHFNGLNKKCTRIHRDYNRIYFKTQVLNVFLTVKRPTEYNYI